MRDGKRVRAEEAGLDALAPVGRETVQDRIHHQLRRALIEGRFDGGEGFAAGPLARRMQTSAMPVREALARLVSERALEAGENRRIRVPALTPERARDLFRARVLVECELAVRAMPHLDADDFAALADLNADYEAARDAGDFSPLNHAFHFRIYARAGSAVLMPVVESLWMQAGPYIRAASRLHVPSSDPSATLHHRRLIDALRARDAAATVVAMTSDIEQTFAILARAPQAFGDGAAAA